jgi:hypothetical protein
METKKRKKLIITRKLILFGDLKVMRDENGDEIIEGNGIVIVECKKNEGQTWWKRWYEWHEVGMPGNTVEREAKRFMNIHFPFDACEECGHNEWKIIRENNKEYLCCRNCNKWK